MTKNVNIAAFILAGGASSRMGHDKVLLKIGGVPLLVRTARLLQKVAGEVTVVGPAEHYLPFGLPGIDDPAICGTNGNRRNGPLAGIAAALAATKEPWNLIVACDLPYLSVEWLEWLVSRATKSQAQAVVPRSESGPEPLAAIYRRECAGAVQSALSRGTRKVADVLEDLRVEYVYQREWAQLDPKDQVLSNMNTPEDYEEARKRAKPSQKIADNEV